MNTLLEYIVDRGRHVPPTETLCVNLELEPDAVHRGLEALVEAGHLQRRWQARCICGEVMATGSSEAAAEACIPAACQKCGNPARLYEIVHWYQAV